MAREKIRLVLPNDRVQEFRWERELIVQELADEEGRSVIELCVALNKLIRKAKTWPRNRIVLR